MLYSARNASALIPTDSWLLPRTSPPATNTRGPGLPTRSMATLRALVTTVRSSRPRSSRMNWETVVPPVVPITRAPSVSRTACWPMRSFSGRSRACL